MKSYEAMTPKSKALFYEASKVMPGGVLGHARYYKPYPIYMKSAKGTKIRDVDGNEYTDYLMGFAALILGHNFPEVEEAILRQVKEAVMLGTAFERDLDLVKLILKHNPSMKWVRMGNSGGEGVMYAVRLARAHTKKPIVAKFEGGYHGGTDDMLVSLHPFLDRAGEERNPIPQAYSRGLYEGVEKNSLILPYNNIDATRDLIRKNSARLAAVIVETVQGYAGAIPGETNFLRELRKVTREEGVLLIFDETITGFRLSLGGGEATTGVVPDIKTLGKIIGGGLPIGAYGGSSELMEVATPTKDLQTDTQQRMFQSGTFNVSPLASVAGAATISYLEKHESQVYSQLDKLGSEARKGIRDVLEDAGFRAQVTGTSSIFSIHFTDSEIRNVRDVMRTNAHLTFELYNLLMTHGIFNLPPVHMNLSAVHNKEDIDDLIEATQECARELKRLAA